LVLAPSQSQSERFETVETSPVTPVNNSLVLTTSFLDISAKPILEAGHRTMSPKFDHRWETKRIGWLAQNGLMHHRNKGSLHVMRTPTPPREGPTAQGFKVRARSSFAPNLQFSFLLTDLTAQPKQPLTALQLVASLLYGATSPPH